MNISESSLSKPLQINSHAEAMAILFPVRRQYDAMRVRIDEMLAQGWSITGRDPVRLELGRMVKQVKGGCLING